MISAWMGMGPGLAPQADTAWMAPEAGLAGTRCCGAGPQLPSVQAAAWMEPQLRLQQTALQLMEMVLGLMMNQARPAPGTAGSEAPAPDSAGKVEASAPSTTSASGGGSLAPTSTGQKLAEIARAEATDGDSKGGLCYRDVGRSLAKIGIQVSGASAYMAAAQLEKNPKVQEVKVSKEELSRLPAGAIVVWDRGNGHVHGHISIATGDGKEASDLMRNQITNYGTPFRVFMPR